MYKYTGVKPDNRCSYNRYW